MKALTVDQNLMLGAALKWQAVGSSVTCSADFYHKFVVATDLAKRFNLLKKSDRIALFQGVLYHNRPMPDLPMFTLPIPAPKP